MFTRNSNLRRSTRATSHISYATMNSGKAKRIIVKPRSSASKMSAGKGKISAEINGLVQELIKNSASNVQTEQDKSKEETTAPPEGGAGVSQQENPDQNSSVEKTEVDSNEHSLQMEDGKKVVVPDISDLSNKSKDELVKLHKDILAAHAA